MIPVHPWQFEHVIQVDLAEERLNGTVLWLGESDELYHPQQSIRTMSPIDTTKYYLKGTNKYNEHFNETSVGASYN